MMSINDIKKILEEQAEKKGYKVIERKSTSTKSWYFKLCTKINSNKEISLLFRVSDHYTKKDVCTLRMDHNITKQTVQHFIDNRCADLSYRVVKILLGM